jgi:hypothetical protein
MINLAVHLSILAAQGRTKGAHFHASLRGFQTNPAVQAAENSRFVPGHGFTGCGETHVLYQGTTKQAAEKRSLDWGLNFPWG